MARGSLPKGWGTPGGVADDVVDIAKGTKKAAEEAGGVVKRVWGAVTGGGKKADSGTSVKKPASTARKVGKWVRRGGKWVLIPVGAFSTASYLVDQFGAGEDEEGYSFDTTALNLMSNGVDQSNMLALLEARRAAAGGGGAGGSGGGGGGYGGMRSGLRNWAGTLRDYGAGQTAALEREYGGLAERADADAAAAEAIARAAYGDIGRIGRDYAQAATQDITSAGPAGPTETTGLVPVSGELYDIPGRIADTSQIAADYVLRDLNLTRDDLAYMGNVARMMGPAYAQQLNNTINMAIANKTFELEQSIAAQQAADRRAAAGRAAQADKDFYDALIALEAQKTVPPMAPADIAVAFNEYEGYLGTAQGRQMLQAAGINSVNDYVVARARGTSTGR